MKKTVFSMMSILLFGALAGCGGGASNSSSTSPLTPAQVAALSATDISTYSDNQITGLGVNIKFLSDAALNALTPWTNTNQNPNGQIESISAAQITALTPAQVRMIGAADPGGSVITSQIQWLNSATWAALVSDPLQMAAITPAEIATIWDGEIAAMGTNIKYLSDPALNALTPWTNNNHNSFGQIESITPTQIAAFSPSQVRMIGAAGPGGSVTTSQIQWLNIGTWSALMSDPLQVAAITPAEVPTLWDSEISAIGTNIKYLSDAALNALTYGTNANNHHDVGQIESITVTQIAALAPAQVRMLGATGPGGSVSTSQIKWLNSGAWSVLVSDPLQVAAITAAEVNTLRGDKIIGMGTSFQYLTNAAMGSISLFDCSGTCDSALYSVTAAQISILTPAQISALSNAITGNPSFSSLAYLNVGAFAALSATQVVGLTPVNMIGVSPSQLASLSTDTLAGFSASTTASFTTYQTSLLSAAQHTSCGC